MIVARTEDSWDSERRATLPVESPVSAIPASDGRSGYIRSEAMSPSDGTSESAFNPARPRRAGDPAGSDGPAGSAADPPTRSPAPEHDTRLSPAPAGGRPASEGSTPSVEPAGESDADHESDDADDTTQILDRLAQGDSHAADELLPLVYEELRSLASACMRSERRDHTLQPTAIVHEAYLRLVQTDKMKWQGRAHFMAVAAAAIRRVLIDHARRSNALKRGGDQVRIALDDHLRVAKAPNLDLLDLNESLERLSAMNPRQSRIVELRFFGGLTNEEVAQVMGLSRATVSDEWAFARAWLARELEVKEA